MTSECVVDAEILKKYCLEECVTSCAKYNMCKKSTDEVIVCLIETETCIPKTRILQESKCLEKFLDFIDKGRCIIYYNKYILTEYGRLELPEPLLGSFNAILSNDHHAIKKDIGGLEGDDLTVIEQSDILRPKQIYLDIAASLSQRRIVSTKEDKENVYHPIHTNGLSLRIEGLDVCDIEIKIRNGQ